MECPSERTVRLIHRGALTPHALDELGDEDLRDDVGAASELGLDVCEGRRLVRVRADEGHAVAQHAAEILEGEAAARAREDPGDRHLVEGLPPATRDDLPAPEHAVARATLEPMMTARAAHSPGVSTSMSKDTRIERSLPSPSTGTSQPPSTR